MTKKTTKKPHGFKRGLWSTEEDARLMAQILPFSDDFDAINWSFVADSFVRDLSSPEYRSGKQCRERWSNSLDPRLNHEKFTEGEGQYLLELNAQPSFRRHWVRIVDQFYKQTGKRKSLNTVKNYFYSKSRRHELGDIIRQKKSSGVQKKNNSQKCCKNPTLTRLKPIITKGDENVLPRMGLFKLTQANNQSQAPVSFPDDGFFERDPLTSLFPEVTQFLWHKPCDDGELDDVSAMFLPLQAGC